MESVAHSFKSDNMSLLLSISTATCSVADVALHQRVFFCAAKVKTDRFTRQSVGSILFIPQSAIVSKVRDHLVDLSLAPHAGPYKGAVLG